MSVEPEATPQSPPSDLVAVAHEAGPVTRRVEVRVGAQRVREAFDRAYRDLGRQVRIKGFRPGKAPRRVLERLYGASVAEEIEQALVQQTLADAIEQVDVTPVVPPAIDARPPQPDAEFSYTALVEVKPVIALPALEGLPGRRPRVEVSDEEITGEVERLRERAAPLVDEPEDTQAATGHVLTIDFVGRIDGAPFEGGSGRGVELEIGSGRFLEGFEAQLEGVKAGEDRSVRITFPDDYANAELAGKEAVFEVHVADVKMRKLPALDDEFAKDVGDFDTLDALRERIRQDLLEMREQRARAELRRSLLDALVARTDFPVPPGLVEQQLERQLRSAHQRLHGQLDHDALHHQLDRWREEWRPAAEREVREALLLEAVIEQQAITPADDEVTAQIERLAGAQGVSVAQLRQAVDADALEAMARRQIAEEKALEFLAATAKVDEIADT